jgi:hypothetical protein
MIPFGRGILESPDDVDLWVGGLAEKYTGDSLAGETLTTILTNQFEALRDGDRFWYENQFSGQQLKDLNKLTLSDVIQRNTTIKDVQDNAFLASNVHAQPQASLAKTAAEPMIATTTKGFAPASAPVVAPVTTPDPEQIRVLQEALAKGLLG